MAMIHGATYYLLMFLIKNIRYNVINSILELMYRHLQGESKKSGISKIMGISSFKYNRKGHIGGVLENSGYLLPDRH